MPKNESTMTWKIDIAQLKAEMQEAKRSISLANAEFKNATAGMDNWQGSIEGVEAKLQQLNSVSASQNAILGQLKSQYEIVSRELGETSPEAQRLAVQIQNQEAACKKTESQIKQYSSQLDGLKKAQVDSRNAAEKLTDTISEQENELGSLKKEYANAVLTYGKNSKEAKSLEKEIKSLSGELKDNKSKMNAAEKAADDLADSTEDAGESAEKAGNGGFSVLKGALANLVAQGISAAISGLKNLVSSVIETGMNFESSMSNVAALSGATGDELQLLTDTARKYGATTQFSASEAADALGYMALAGWDANKSASELGGVLNLAAASGMDLAEASDMVTDYLSAFSNSTMTATEFADKLAYAQANSNTSAAQLGEAYKNSAANLNAAGQSVDTVTALLAGMANQGLKGSEAGTALTAMMRDLTAKMKKGSVQIGKTKIAVQDANGNYRNMIDILADVEAATDGMGDAQRASALSSVFTSDSIKGLNLVLNDGVDNSADFAARLGGMDSYLSHVAGTMGLTEEQAADFAEQIKACGDSSEDIAKVAEEFGMSAEEALEFADGLKVAESAAEEMAKTMNDNLSGDIKSMKSAWEELNLILYESANGPLRGIVQEITGGLLPALQEFVKGTDGAGAEVGAAFASLLTTAIGEFGKMLPQLIEMGTVLGTNLLLGLMQSFPMLLDRVADGISAFLSAIQENAPLIIAEIPTLFSNIVEVISTQLPWLVECAISMVMALIQGISDTIPSLISEISYMIPTIVSTLMELLPTLLQAGSDILNAIISGLLVAIPLLAEQIPTIIDTVVGTLMENLPMILDAAISLFNEIVNAIPIIAQALIANLPQIIDSIVNTLITNLPVVLDGAITLLMAIVQALPTIIQSLVVELPSIISTITGTLLDNLPAVIGAATTLLLGIIDAIPEIVAQLILNMPQIIGSIVEGLEAGFGDIFDVGENLIKGLWEGISSVGGWILDKIEGFAGSIVDGIKGFFGINSPSKLMRDAVGKFLPEGIAVGFEDDMPKAQKEMQKSLNAAVNGLKADLSLASGNIIGTNEIAGSVGGVAVGAAGGQTITFNQYNNSPKALDRLSIYRETNSLLFGAKVRLSNV